MATINNWKFVTESEVKEFEDKLFSLYDPHYEDNVEVLGVVASYNGHNYLCAYDYISKTVYPVVEKNERLELLNSITVGVKGEGCLEESKNFFKTEENFNFIRNAS